MYTRVCDLLGIRYPIVQAGMGPFTSAELVAAVSAAGALGSLGTSNRPAASVRQEIAGIHERTDHPFAVNFLATALDEESFDVTLAMGAPIISFALGDPGEHVRRAHDAGARVIQQVHTVTQAKQAAERGVDVLIAQGSEAGGFGQSVATMPLVPQVVDAVWPLPVLAAGGIADGRGIAAALVLGAQGVNLGTLFLASVEAPVSEAWKQLIVTAQSEDAVRVDFWNEVMPQPGRGGYGTIPRAIRTSFWEQWARHDADVRQHVDEVRAELGAALAQGRFAEYIPFAGETVGLIREVLPVAEVVRRLVEETDAALARASALLMPVA